VYPFFVIYLYILILRFEIGKLGIQCKILFFLAYQGNLEKYQSDSDSSRPPYIKRLAANNSISVLLLELSLC